MKVLPERHLLIEWAPRLTDQSWSGRLFLVHSAAPRGVRGLLHEVAIFRFRQRRQMRENHEALFRLPHQLESHVYSDLLEWSKDYMCAMVLPHGRK